MNNKTFELYLANISQAEAYTDLGLCSVYGRARFRPMQEGVTYVMSSPTGSDIDRKWVLVLFQYVFI